MAGPWLVVALAMSVASVDEDASGDELDAGPDEEAEAVADAAPAPEPAVPLLPAPHGRRLAESAPVLLDRFERPDGTAVERVVETSGEVVLHEVNRVGTVLSCRAVARLQALRIVQQRDAVGGETIHVVRDDSGAILRYVVDREGEPRAVALIAPAPR
jgi:hypothetical protein